MIFFEPSVLSSDGLCVRFDAKEGSVLRGSCDLRIHDNAADIVSCSLMTDDLSIGEGLFRAAFHYAGNRGVYFGCCSASGCDSVRALFPFEQKNGMWRCDIPTLLTGSCRKN